MKIGVKLLMAFTAVLFFAFSCKTPSSDVSTTEILTFDTLKWEKFYEGSVEEVEIDNKTHYLLEGDILTSNLEDVQNYYKQLTDRSTVNVFYYGSKLYADIYSESAKDNLTYTIASNISNTVRSDIEWALGQWETYASVDFINVTGTGQTPIFMIRNATVSEENALPDVVASAFFPSYSNKELILFDDFYDLFANGSLWYGWDKKAVLLHELGHGLGLRHEFIWTYYYGYGWYQTQENGAQAYLLSTNRDNYSIMYYPQFSAYRGNGRLSSEDKIWIEWLYP